MKNIILIALLCAPTLSAMQQQHDDQDEIWERRSLRCCKYTAWAATACSFPLAAAAGVFSVQYRQKEIPGAWAAGALIFNALSIASAAVATSADMKLNELERARQR